jgi:hypothetical protein
MTTLTTAWIAELVLIAYRSSKQTGAVRPIPGLALPSEYAASFIIYGALSLVPEGPGARVAGLVGWGVVVATFLNLWDPATVSKGSPKVKHVTPTASKGPVTA